MILGFLVFYFATQLLSQLRSRSLEGKIALREVMVILLV
jgi:hypothetical protein